MPPSSAAPTLGALAPTDPELALWLRSVGTKSPELGAWPNHCEEGGSTAEAWDPLTRRRKGCGGFKAAAGNRCFLEESCSPARALSEVAWGPRGGDQVSPGLPGAKDPAAGARRWPPEATPVLSKSIYPLELQSIQTLGVSDAGSGEVEEGVRLQSPPSCLQ